VGDHFLVYKFIIFSKFYIQYEYEYEYAYFMKDPTGEKIRKTFEFDTINGNT